jgi:hypothetical protein
VIDPHPPGKDGQRRIVKIHHRNVAAWNQVATGGGDRRIVAGIEHGERVGKEHEIEVRLIAQRRVVGSVSQPHAVAESRRLPAGQREHCLGKIDPGD